MTTSPQAQPNLSLIDKFNPLAEGSFLPPSVLSAVQNAQADCFDLDGTLLDNEGMALDQMQNIIAKELELKLPNALVRALAGRPKEYIVERCMHVGGRVDELSSADMAKVLNKITEARAMLTEDDDIQPMGGILQYLNYRERSGVIRIINTSSERERAELHVKHFPSLADYFTSQAGKLKLISCETDFGRDFVKPHSRGYITAVDRNNIHADKTVSYEDTVSGVKSAAGAGIKTIIGVVGGTHISDRKVRSNELLEAGAVGVINDFRELIPALQLAQG